MAEKTGLAAQECAYVIEPELYPTGSCSAATFVGGKEL